MRTKAPGARVTWELIQHVPTPIPEVPSTTTGPMRALDPGIQCDSHGDEAAEVSRGCASAQFSRRGTDHLVHDSEIISIEGESYREREAEAAKEASDARRRKKRS